MIPELRLKFCDKPNSNPNLSPSPFPLPGEATVVLTEMMEMQVAAQPQTRCCIFRL